MRAASALGTIGNTPHIRLSRLSRLFPDAEVWIKSERGHSGGSLRDRVALAMIDAAERSGALAPDGIIVEGLPTENEVGASIYRSPKRFSDDSLAPGNGGERCGNRGFSGYRTT